MTKRGGLPADRTIARNQGCWNCRHWSPDGGVAFWNRKRIEDLAVAKQISGGSAEGEEDVRVKNICATVNKVDIAMAQTPATFGLCLEVIAKQRVGDLVHNAFLCDRWSGVQGTSLLREGGALDKLPGELVDRIDGSDAVKEQKLT